MEMINYMPEMQMMFFREDQARIFLTVSICTMKYYGSGGTKCANTMLKTSHTFHGGIWQINFLSSVS